MLCNFHVDSLLLTSALLRPTPAYCIIPPQSQNLTAQMKPNLSTEHWRKELDTIVNRIRKSAAVKTSMILKNLLAESRAHPGPAADALLNVVGEALFNGEKAETVSCCTTFPISRTNDARRWPPARRAQEFLLDWLPWTPKMV